MSRRFPSNGFGGGPGGEGATGFLLKSFFNMNNADNAKAPSSKVKDVTIARMKRAQNRRRGGFLSENQGAIPTCYM